MADTMIHANLALAAGAVFIPVCSVTVGLRVYARQLRGAGLGADDWTIIAALVFVIGMGVTLISEIGLKELGYPTPDSSTTVGKPDSNIAFWPVELLQVPALGLVKLSFIFFYRRIFTKSAASTFNLVTWFMIFILVSWMIAFLFALLFICGANFSAYWASTIVEKANCTNTSMLHNAFAISDVVTDILVIALPIPMIWGLHLTTGRKIGITAVFSLGAITIATSIVRMVFFIQLTAANYNPNADFELLCTSGLYWSMIESGLGLCAACLPAQYSLIKTRGLQSVIRSVQSAISLRSISRNRSPHGSNDMPSKLESQPSNVHITAYAEGPSRDDPSLEMGPVPSKNTITVTHSIEASEGTVKDVR